MNDEIKVPTMQVPPIKRVCMTIGQLPASYVETMSYYEMLVWFVNYLRDDIIPVVNANGLATKELQELFVQLQSYVNTYFDNLDVQDEINNKLDEMADSGELTDIIAQYLGLAGMITFDTVADMKLAENLVNGSKCATLGFYNVNDGGKAVYKIRTITNDDVVNESTIIALYDNSLIAELIFDGKEINIKQFGCKVDGETDDTTKLQIAISYLSNAGISNYTLVIPGITCISDEIDFTETGITLKGYNINKCGILLSGETTFIKFGESSTNHHEINIRDLFIRGDYTQPKLLQFTRIFNIYLNRVYLNQPADNGYLIRFDNSGIIFIKECIFDSSEDVENHPASANGLFLSKNDAIFDMQGCNCWNLNKLIHCEGTCLQTNIVGNWIENCRTVFYHTNATDLRYMNLNITRNHYDIHDHSSFTAGNPSLITLNETSSTNAYNSFIKIIDNELYFWNTTALAGNSLLYITDGDNSGTMYLEYSGNIWSGKTANDLQSYIVKLGNDHKPLVKIIRFDTNSRLESVWACDYEPALLCSMRNETSTIEQCFPNGITLCKSATNGNGQLRYDKTSNNFVGKYNGTELIIPKRYLGETIPYPVNTTNYIDALNAICRVINNSNLGIIQS